MRNVSPTAVWPVPWDSQIGNIYPRDCGGVMVDMAKLYKGVPLTMTIGDVYGPIDAARSAEHKGEGINMAEVDRWMDSHGVPGSWQYIETPGELFEIVRMKKPVLALIHYGDLVSSGYCQYSDFLKGHYVIVCGMDLVYVYINDPYYSTDAGQFVPIPIKTFFEAWRNCTLDQNPNYAGFVPDKGYDIPTPSVVMYMIPKLDPAHGNVNQAVYLHLFNYQSSKIIGYLYVNTPVTIMPNSDFSGYVELTKGGWAWGPWFVLAPAG